MGKKILSRDSKNFMYEFPLDKLLTNSCIGEVKKLGIGVSEKYCVAP